MANTAQALKRIRQTNKARAQNASQRSTIRTVMKKFLKAIEAKDIATAEQEFSTAASLLDRAARKHIIHKNKANRLKSRMHAKKKALVA
ncbi:30S ribosomal protein S20 [Dichelobacter nodosus]|uniref:30S ribosomal protein S20 n=1 Tax=Dichelobacter nodosus TaxID=870 RepID=UPI00107E7938|nr:30S ribosomal protein S20 [Dichelobacter nodosus]TGA64430.1 30S ribosomal protein S20 [Dichelobacter nodosus]